MLLDPTFKKEWTIALRSGKYPQGRRRLLGPEGYCCLGVACVVLGIPLVEAETFVANVAEQEAYDMLAETIPGISAVWTTLWTMNDADPGSTAYRGFQGIADWIDANL